ncbi:hypothetical protein CLHUN_01860 [Ruminiclostridium hungatei]|uniref:Uncharacterized protein n=1 Tax=Ruminiclostridium hungatei TaxID=48256 RepID=A0A1V4SR67_RUMHU|nr:hypothetical protein [Ruminiclostridium hungatei]OPX46370.1 hypothetical protein CLHUN_01860 [Ruminiclostridium hungatei]
MINNKDIGSLKDYFCGLDHSVFGHQVKTMARHGKELIEVIEAQQQEIDKLKKYESEYPGLKVKYRVFKARNNEPVEGCFVLRPDKDLAARTALRAYMHATDNYVLQQDLKKWIAELEGGDGLATNNRCSQNSSD